MSHKGKIMQKRKCSSNFEDAIIKTDLILKGIFGENFRKLPLLKQVEPGFIQLRLEHVEKKYK